MLPTPSPHPFSTLIPSSIFSFPIAPSRLIPPLPPILRFSRALSFLLSSLVPAAIHDPRSSFRRLVIHLYLFHVASLPPAARFFLYPPLCFALFVLPSLRSSSFFVPPRRCTSSPQRAPRLTFPCPAMGGRTRSPRLGGKSDTWFSWCPFSNKGLCLTRRVARRVP